MSSLDNNKVAGQFLDLDLEVSRNLVQSGTFLFSALELVVLLTELVFQFGSFLLGSIQLGGMSSSS